jgi:uncharacterized protein
MKKTFIIILCLLMTLLALHTSVFATNETKVVDNADILTESQEANLEKEARSLVAEYSMDVVILTVLGTNGEDIMDLADDYFDYNGYGIGSKNSGVILVLDMSGREWWLSTCGDTIDALTDYGQEKLMDEVIPYFSDGNYYDGFRTYLAQLDVYFGAYERGEPIDRGTNYFLIVAVALVVGALVGWITILVMKSGMKTIKPQRSAQSYVNQNSFKILRQRDMFFYSRTSKTRKPSSSSGGSSTHRSSSGRRHGGSRGRF